MFKLLALLVLSIGFAFFSRMPEEELCAEPILYNIGGFDRRFDISQKQFLRVLGEAEDIWEKPLGKELFSYSPQEGDLKVNLIYDYRQQTTEELNQLEREVSRGEAAYGVLEQRYLNLRNDPDASIAEINALVDQLNVLAKKHNLSVEEYNILGASRGETFAGGLYVSDESGETISIYEFENYEKLMRVLAHELGHVLGLEHVEDKEAIMYELNRGEAGRASPSDLFALKTLCQII